MPPVDTEKRASRVTVLVDLRVVIEPGYVTRYIGEDPFKALERWAREFESFVRDHRSEDRVSLNVERVTRDECDLCSNLWETYDEDGKRFCAGCGVEVSDATR